MPYSEWINIRLQPAGPELVLIDWQDSTGGRFPAYGLYRRELDRKSQAVRTALEKIGAIYRHPLPNYTAALISLAEHGRELRSAIFMDCRPEDRNIADEVQNWFEGLTRDSAQPIVINVHTDPVLPIPWSLLHEHGPKEDRDTYEGFWALRHKISARYSGMKPQIQTARSAKNVMLLAAINEATFEGTRQHLDNEAKEFVFTFLERPVGRALSSGGCEKLWERVGDNDCVIYFFGHASGSELHFSETDQLTASSFRRVFRRESRVVRLQTELKYVLSFLNGCASVAGYGADNFLIATADPGFCGFIGAEAVVPDRFALLFGQEFLYCLMVEGLSVLQAMSCLWQKHRPMALFYGCYANPNFAIARDDEHRRLPVTFNSCNFHSGQGLST